MTLDVKSYFSDPEGDTLTYTASNLPAGLSLDPNSGLITGTIDNSASQGGTAGVYTVTVTATDDNGDSVSTTMTWSVTNPGPTATANTAAVTEDTSLTDSGNVITDNDGAGVDSDPDSDLLAVGAVNGVAGNVGIGTAGAYGSIQINNNGDYTYTLDNSDPAVSALDIGETLTETFTYTLTDSEGGISTASITITINGTNDAPLVAGSIPDQSDNDADTISTLDVTSYFSDPDGDTLTYHASNLPTGLTLDPNTGLIAGTIDSSASQGGTAGVYTVTVTATDDNGESVSTTMTWTVTNPSPSATANQDGVFEGGTLSGGNLILDDDGSGVDNDVDGDTLTVSEINGNAALVGVAVTGSNGGEFTTNSDGSYNFDTKGDFDYLAAGETASTQVSYTVSDGEGGVATATLTITVTGTNDDPTQVGSIPDQADLDSGLIGLDVASYFNDADTLDTLSFTATGLPAGLSIDSAGNITGTLDSSASQGGPSSDGVFAVTVTATDGQGGSVDQTFTWTITNVRPVADNDIYTTDADVLLTGNNVLDNDMDPDGDTITVTALGNMVGMWPGSVGTPQPGIGGGLFTVNSDGSWTFDPNGDFDYLAPGEQATTYVIYQIQDADGSLHSAVLGLYVDGVNDAPQVVGPIADQNDFDGDNIATVDVTSAFFDPEGDSLTYTATGLPGGLSLDLNSGEITGSIDSDASQGGPLIDGVYTVVVTATDAGGESSSTTFSWTIGNPAPTAFDNAGSVTEDTAISTSGNVISDNDGLGVDVDPDGDALLVTSVNGSAANVGVEFAGTYGNFTIESDGSYFYDVDGLNPLVNALDNSDTLTETITYTIDDGEGGSDTATLTITINGSNDAPIAGGTIPPQSDSDADTIAAIDVSTVFSDPEGDTLTYTATGLPAGLTLDLNSGLISGTIDNSASQGGPLSDGVYAVQVRATDDNFSSVTTTFNWTVGNPTPTAIGNAASVTEDTLLTDSGNVITDNDGSGADSDPDNDALSVAAVNGLGTNVGVTVVGTYGSIQIDSNGDYTYTLDNNNPTVSALDNSETLIETFDYTLTDSEGGTSTATITITIDGANDAPLVTGAIPDQSDNDADTITTLDVTSYFSDPDGDTLTYSASNLPTGLTLDSNTGLITGTIDSSASQGGTAGVYTVTVTATDDNGEINSSDFTWTVGNPGPTATGNSADVTEDTSLTDSGNVVADDDGSGVDTDPDGDLLAVSAVEGVGANVGVSVAGTYGSVVIDSTGSYTYTLNNSHPSVAGLDNGETLSDFFTYTISDGEGGSSTSVLSVTINGTNDAPIVGGTIPDQNDYDADVISALDVTSYFTDPDGDTLTYSATNLPAGLSIDPIAGLITGTIDSSASQGGTAGAYTVTITATDDNGESVSTTLTWTVPNPGPNATPNTAEVTEDSALTDSGNVITDDDGSGVDTDPDNDVLSVGAVDGVAGNVGIATSGTYGSIQIDSNGAYTYTLDNDNLAVSALGNGESLTETFNYTVTDNEGGTNSAFVTITINGANDAPVVGGTIPDQANQDDETISTIDVKSFFSDPEGDALTYTASNLPAGLSLDLNSGLITGTIDNDASQGGTAGVYTVTITASDDNGESVSTTLNWTVTNPGPTATDNTAAVTEDSSLTDSGNVITDNDGSGVDSDPDGDALSVGAVNGVPGNVGVATLGTYGSIQIDSNGNYTYTLDNNNPAVSALDNSETLTETFNYTLTDSEGGTSVATITITINGTNDTPLVAGSIPDQSDNDGDAITTVDVTSFFSDPDGDTLTYTASNLPTGLSLDPNSGLITGVIDSSASQGGTAGVYTVTVTATDDNGESVNSTFAWTVNNLDPTATSNTANVTEDTSLTVDGNVITDDDGSGVDSDPDSDALTIGAVNGLGTNVGVTVAGTYGSIQIDSNGDYTYTLTNNNPTVSALDNGETLTETFDYTLTDSEGGTSTATITITINGTNDTPLVAGSIPDQSDHDADAITTLDVTSYFSDPDGDTLTYHASNLPTGLTLDSNTGLITGTIDNSASQGGTAGVYAVTVTATDDNGEAISSTFAWTVTNPDPTATDNTAGVTEDTSLTDSGNVISDNDGGAGVDSDPDNDLLSVSSVEGVGTNVGMILTGLYGDIQINSDGSYTYTLDNSNPAVTALDSGDSISESFTYTLTDGEGGFSAATLTVTVNGANTAPIVGGTVPNQINQDDDLITAVDVTSYFSDPDGDTLTYTASNLPAGLSLDLNTGLITGTIDNSASQGGSAGAYMVTISATDDNGASVSTTMTWTVTNPGPTATDNTAGVTEDIALTDSGNVITDNDGAGVDTDPDNDLLNVSAVNGSATNVGISTAGVYGSIQVNSDGSYTYTLDNNNPAVSALDNGETLTESFDYTAQRWRRRSFFWNFDRNH